MKAGFLLLLLFELSFITTNAQTMQDNQLTAQEKNEGWKLLFDGYSLNNFRTYQNITPSNWVVEEGTLHCVENGPRKEGMHPDLITEDQFENFELSIDWKLAPKGNSGIIYLVSEEYKQPYLTGPEYQILDDPSYSGQIEPYQHTGANYAMNAPSEVPTKPIDEWNHTRIIVNHGHVEHWLNGKKVVSYDLWTDEWKKNKEKGKWKDAPGYGKNKKGHISLQDHAGSEVWFKNIKIRELR